MYPTEAGEQGTQIMLTLCFPNKSKFNEEQKQQINLKVRKNKSLRNLFKHFDLKFNTDTLTDLTIFMAQLQREASLTNCIL